MKNEEQVRIVLLRILQIGLLRIRSFGWDGKADECAKEADHLHNLPELLENFQLDRVRQYLEVYRNAFMKQAANTEQFVPQWNRLQRLLEDAESQDES